MTWSPQTLTAAEVATVVDPHFDRSLAAGQAPGMVYGVLRGGSVLHGRGIGVSALPTGAPPALDTVFRVASMTKSFTAATLLGLRDDRLLDLDAPVVTHVPELAGGGPVAEQITVRQLMTMGGGFLTDDPWGDRQQDLPLVTFRKLVAGGLAPTLAPGERFEYSNLGYALLGLVVESVTGLAYPDAVRQRVLVPLGMAASGYEVTHVGGAAVASGYVRRSTGWVQEEIAASGAFSPMGGLLSTVNDLARWVGVMQTVHARPWQAGQGAPQILPTSPSSLHEMQVTQRLVAAATGREPGATPEVTGYGFGLFEDFRSWGRTVHHSGGYPGFGSHMRWHPASGLGIVALANGSYAPMTLVATAALQDLVERLEAPRHPAPLELPTLQLAKELVTDWLLGDDPGGDSGARFRTLCSDNVEQDVPWAERLAQWQDLRRSHGRLSVVPGSESRPSPGSVRWLCQGSAAPGQVRVTVMLAPHDPTSVQSVELRPIDPATPAPPVAADLT